MGIMVDYAEKDRRSFAAMLRGNGDGREKLFENFRNSEILRDPLLSEEELLEVYKSISLAEYFRDKQADMPTSGDWLTNVY